MKEQPAEPAETPPVVVGIGASAGGLEALKELIKTLPAADGLILVVVQHLSPRHKSLLSELLTPSTEMPVEGIEDGVVPVANTIYVTPPNHNVTLENNQLRLSPVAPGPGPKPSVDIFFQSLSVARGEFAVAIVLSGTGSDGAAGLRAIKAAGGVTIVQEPATAKYDGMPRAAINTGCVDLVLAPEKIGPALQTTVVIPTALAPPSQHEFAKDKIGQIAAIVRGGSGLDLSLYKESTVSRRIRRRMVLNGVDSLGGYVELLRAKRNESKQLARDVLISVTSFMRDPAVFDSLRDALTAVIKKRNPEEPFRCWVPGCATGEEAYTIVMLYHEICRELKKPAHIVVFATDVDSNALEVARRGEYNASSIESLPKEMRENYLEESGDNFRVRSSLRQCLVFAAQNVVDDPPFSRVDLVSCRNLLIYFTRPAQRRALEIFHFSLNKEGLLLLGQSESIESHEELFSAENKTTRLYRRSDSEAPYAMPLSQTGKNLLQFSTERQNRAPKPEISSIVHRSLAERYVPAAVLVDVNDRVVHFHGELREILNFPEDAGNLDLFDMINARWRPEFRALLSRARREAKPISGARITVQGTNQQVMPITYPLYPEGTELMVIVFEPASPLQEGGQQGETSITEGAIIGELERELASTREHLQTVVEELETSNEELQSQSEELQSANEELQSTNEELQTSNEELQSTNEELMTVNDELQDRSTELAEVVSTLENLKESLEMPIMVVDQNLQILLHNSACRQLLDIHQLKDDRSSQLLSVNWFIEIDELLSATRRVMQHQKMSETLIDGPEGSRLLLRAMPFSNTDSKIINSAVLSFTDISSQRDVEQAIAFEKDRMRVLLESIGDAVVGIGYDGNVTYINPAFARMMGAEESECVGRDFTKLLVDYRAAGLPSIVEYLKEQLEDLNSDLEKSGDFSLSNSDDEEVPVYAAFARLNSGIESPHRGLVVVIRDVTEQRLLTKELSYRASHDTLTGLCNRHEFMRQVRISQAQNQVQQPEHAVLFMDLDHFKIINDTCGHAAGDELLKQISQMLRDELRSGDVLARMGGDEFAAILNRCPLDQAERMAQQIIDRILSFRFRWHEQAYSVGISIGITNLDSESSLALIISRADSACYRAKQAGRGRWSSTTGAEHLRGSEHSDLKAITLLSRAIEQNQLTLYYEDVVDANDVDQVHYREMLVRIWDSNGRLIPPIEFLPAAERYMLTSQLDRWVIARTLRHIEEYQPEGIIYAINLSGHSLGDAHFMDVALNLVKSSNVDPSALCFEVTESHAIAHLQESVRFINKFREIGCKFALDDFGVGMSSFSYLKELPVDYLKIDSSFIKNLDSNEVDRKMVTAINVISHEMKLKTIAEHIDSEAVLKQAQVLGVDYLQGHHICVDTAIDSLTAKNTKSVKAKKGRKDQES